MCSKVHSQTCSAARKGKNNDIIIRPRVVFVWRVESQFPHALLPQIEQHCGMDHRHREAAQSLAVTSGEILCCSTIVALKKMHARERLSVYRLILELQAMFSLYFLM